MARRKNCLRMITKPRPTGEEKKRNEKEKGKQRGKGGASSVFKVREGREDKAREGSMDDWDCE